MMLTLIFLKHCKKFNQTELNSTQKCTQKLLALKIKKVTEVYKNAAQKILELGVELNAGHDLDQQNLKDLIENIPQLKEVSIGHALICEALYEGLEATIKNYLRILCR